jgi:hypothetical protein
LEIGYRPCQLGCFLHCWDDRCVPPLHLAFFPLRVISASQVARIAGASHWWVPSSFWVNFWKQI